MGHAIVLPAKEVSITFGPCVDTAKPRARGRKVLSGDMDRSCRLQISMRRDGDNAGNHVLLSRESRPESAIGSNAAPMTASVRPSGERVGR
jgi:hypothetical protein